jgi:hypothetical protein
MVPSETNPTWDHEQYGPSHRLYPEMSSPAWVTISEGGRPGARPHEHEPHVRYAMKSEYELGSSHSVRMFVGPVGPSPEEDRNAPFYVPSDRIPPLVRYEHGFHGVPDNSLSRCLPPYYKDQDDRRNGWGSEALMNGPQHSYTNREPLEEERSSYSVQRQSPRDRKIPTFPYPRKAQHRDHSKDRHTPANTSRSRRQNPGSRHHRRAGSATRHRNSREPSLPKTSQPRREDVGSPRPLSRTDLSSDSSHKRGFSSPPRSLPLSPISTSSVAAGSWDGTPPREDTNMGHVASPLNQMLPRQISDETSYRWRSTGQGPNPYSYPQWEDWHKEVLPPRP